MTEIQDRVESLMRLGISWSDAVDRTLKENTFIRYLEIYDTEITFYTKHGKTVSEAITLVKKEMNDQ
jgi:hypothetical protein